MAEKKKARGYDPNKDPEFLNMFGSPLEDEGPSYNAEADSFLNGIYTGRGLDDPKQPGRTIYEGGILAGKTRLKGAQAISYIQKQLIRAGLLDPEDVTHPGSPADLATRDAMTRARDAQTMLNTRSVLETLEVLGSGFGGWEKMKQARAAFTPPPRQKTSAKDVASVARAAAREFKGEDASEDDINRILTKVRAGEEQEYQGIAADQRQAYDAADGGASPGAVTINRAPSVSSIAEEEFLRSEEGLQWSVGKGILGLLSSMRSGG